MIFLRKGQTLVGTNWPISRRWHHLSNLFINKLPSIKLVKTWWNIVEKEGCLHVSELSRIEDLSFSFQWVRSTWSPPNHNQAQLYRQNSGHHHHHNRDCHRHHHCCHCDHCGFAGKFYDVRLIVLFSLRKFSATLLPFSFFVS